MTRQEFKSIEEEASHRRFRWIMDNKDFVPGDVKGSLNYWIAVVAQEWTNK